MLIVQDLLITLTYWYGSKKGAVKTMRENTMLVWSIEVNSVVCGYHKSALPCKWIFLPYTHSVTVPVRLISLSSIPYLKHLPTLTLPKTPFFLLQILPYLSKLHLKLYILYQFWPLLYLMLKSTGYRAIRLHVWLLIIHHILMYTCNVRGGKMWEPIIKWRTMCSKFYLQIK